MSTVTIQLLYIIIIKIYLFVVCSLSLPIFVANVCVRVSLTSFEELIERTGWVSPPGINLDSLCDEHNLPVANTGKWIFEKVEYKRWQESKGSNVLWLCGGPGTGKTMLAKSVATEILGGPNGLPEGVKLIFCFIPPEADTSLESADEDQLSQLRLAKVVGGLLNSIREQDENLFNRCKAELERKGERLSNNTSSLWKVLETTIRDCQADLVYILIDGVDGLGGKSSGDLIERILRLTKIGTVKIFLTSHDIPYISNSALTKSPELIRIDLDTTSFVKMDVEAFVKGKLNSWGWNVELRERAVGALVEKAEGIFLWASLAINSLQGSSLGPDFDDLITKPPLGLEAEYRKMMHNLFSRKPSSAVLNLIQSVALALRPLTFSELDYLLGCIEEDARVQSQSSLTRASTKIQLEAEEKIRMYVKSSMGFLRAAETTVSLVHHTIIPYIFNTNNALRRLSKSETERAISWVCFQYLHDIFGDREKDHKEEPGQTSHELARKLPREAVGQQTFLRYAAESWFIHARRSIEISEEDFYDPAQNWLQHQFFETSDIIRKPWIELCGDSRMEILAGEQTPLHIAVCLGLVTLVHQILSDLTWGTYRTRSPPKHIAAKLKARVKEFAGDRAYRKEINKKNCSGNTPLHLATEFNHREIVKCLVKGGANPAIKNNDQMTALKLAEKLGRRDILDILKKASPGKVNVRYNTGWLFYISPDQLISISLYGLKMVPCSAMSFGNSDSLNANIINDYGVQVPSYIPGIWPFLTSLSFEIMSKNLYSNL